MKSFKTFVAEAALKPGSEDHFNHHRDAYIHHAVKAQEASDVAGAHTPGGRDVTASEPEDHTRKSMEHLSELIKYYPKKVPAVMAQVKRRLSGD